jgi:hypothetical protein
LIGNSKEIEDISTKRHGVIIMKKFLLAVLLTALPHLSHAQVEDGIYVIPELDAYSVILTNNNVVRGYLFSLRGFWSEIRGSRIDDVIELAEVTNKDISSIKVTGGVLGATIESIYCNPFPLDDGGCKDDAGPFRALPILKASGSLKAIYQTQYGTDLVVFESDGIAVILSFEYGDSTSRDDQERIGAYTANISDELAIFNIEAVVESEDSGGEVEISFEVKISDRINPQAEFINFQCGVTEKDTLNDDCEKIEKIYFSKLIRIF